MIMFLPPYEDDGLPKLLAVGKNHLLEDPHFGILVGAPLDRGGGVREIGGTNGSHQP